MNIKTEFPHKIRELENVWVPLADGTKLAARIWLPEDAADQAVPAVLEYLPYRKSDGTAVRDALRHPYLAGHGYAAIRVDMRGSGDADGILHDEYLQQEQDDALELLAWIADQPWCSRNVGIFGKSWGGFNALQIAARRPPQLKAIMPMHFTDDRYADDVHYMGGCVLAYDALPWASIMLAYNATPPDPRFVGERWREMWLERLEKTPPYIEAWLSHQRRDAFWQHGSVCEDYSTIECAVYAVGGWADGYTNAVPRLLAGLRCPRKGIIGPWSHNFPEVGTPGPAVGFLQESLRWWDYWLKGVDTGIMAEPMLRAWLQESLPPRVYYAYRPGRWVAEPAWPPAQAGEQRYALDLSASLRPLPHAAWGDSSLTPMTIGDPLTFTSPQATGIDTGAWCPDGESGDFPPDQRAEDGRSLTFTSAPAAEAVDILGYPEVTLLVAADQPVALLAVRLCDLAPDGSSALVSWGVLNLTHRHSHEFPELLTPGEKMSVTVQLNAIGYTLLPGHRWRVGISTSYWPQVWPAPHPVALTLFTGDQSVLRLPVRSPQPQDNQLAPFGPVETAAPYPLEVLRPAGVTREKREDGLTGEVVMKMVFDDGRLRFRDNGLELDDITTNIYTIVEGDPLSASVECERWLGYRRGSWEVDIHTHSTMTADAIHFHATNQIEAFEGHTCVFSKSWSFTIPRDLV